MTTALRLLTSVPDDVLARGDVATTLWLRGHVRTAMVPQADVLGCTGAIAMLIGGTLVPAAKIIKIKRYMNALGGLKEAVRLMWGASFSYEKMAAAGGALEALAGELLGITAVRDSCFE